MQLFRTFYLQKYWIKLLNNDDVNNFHNIIKIIKNVKMLLMKGMKCSIDWIKISLLRILE